MRDAKRRADALRAAKARQRELTKPPGSLGRLEDVALVMAEVQGEPRPQARPAAALLFAADHPVTKHGISAYPSSVTAGMVGNFGRGGAAASVGAVGVLGLSLHVHDVGVDTPYAVGPPPDGISVVRHACAGETAGDLAVEDAMSPTLFAGAVRAGADAVRSLDPSPRVVILGEMGIGNTTPASAVTAALLDRPAVDVVGPGTGVDAAGLARKAAVITRALARLDDRSDPREVLRRVGGREMAALFGAALAAMDQEAIVLVDGFIVTAAILAAVRHCPDLAGHLLFAHRSGEPGHALLLDALHAEPLLDLGLRLGEGSGAIAAFGLVELACRLHAEMATFDEAALAGPSA
ncbi:MAG: nicotinate-nucleotide--dimethylbenzimidazole phosphoribosyltransferase [Myxococcota bacterium]